MLSACGSTQADGEADCSQRSEATKWIGQDFATPYPPKPILPHEDLTDQRVGSAGTVTEWDGLSQSELIRKVVELKNVMKMEQQDRVRFQQLHAQSEGRFINLVRRNTALKQQLEAEARRCEAEVSTKNDVMNLNAQLTDELCQARIKIEKLERQLKDQRLDDTRIINALTEEAAQGRRQIDDLMLLNEDLQDKVANLQARGPRAATVIVPGVTGLDPPRMCTSCKQTRQFVANFPWQLFERNWRDFKRFFDVAKAFSINEETPTREGTEVSSGLGCGTEQAGLTRRQTIKAPSLVVSLTRETTSASSVTAQARETTGSSSVSALPRETAAVAVETKSPIVPKTPRYKASKSGIEECRTAAGTATVESLELGEIEEPAKKKRRGRPPKAQAKPKSRLSKRARVTAAEDLADMENDILQSLPTN